MSVQSGELVSLPEFPKTGQALLMFPEGAYRANLYVYDPYGRIDWYALLPQSFGHGRTFTLGRGADCNIALNDGSVSTRHACITAARSRLVLRDLHSTNGTTLNGDTVDEAVLQHGDVIRVGATDIRFLYSYRDSPVNLVLDFSAGPNAGKSVATYGASTNIGRLNCAINLSGAGVAAQHVRIDAFGRALLFVVNLHRDNQTWLNGQPVQGIAPAKEGDVLRVGQHEITLRIAEPDELLDAVPQGDGTLLVTPRSGVKAPVAQMSAEDLARMEAHLQDLGPIDDDTAFDLGGPALVRSPTPPTPAPSGRTVERPIPKPPQVAPPKRGGVLRPALLAAFSVIVLGAFVVGAMIEVPTTHTINGTTLAGAQHPVVSTARGRVENVYFKPGDTVQAGDVLLTLTDLQVRTELDELDRRIASARTRTEKPTVKVVAGKVPAALRARLARAETAADAAQAKARSTLDAFNRREVGFAALEAARAAETAARRRVYQLRAQVDEAKNTERRIKLPGAPASSAAELAELTARRDALQARVRVSIKAGVGGQLVAGATAPPQTGVAVLSGQQLFNIVDTARLGVQLDVPYALIDTVQDRSLSLLVGEQPVTVALGQAAQAPDEAGRYAVTGQIDNRQGTHRVGAPVAVTVEHGSVSGLSWIWTRLTGR